jgi:hypothetical protein
MNRTRVIALAWLLVIALPIGVSAAATAAIDRETTPAEDAIAIVTPVELPAPSGTFTVLCDDPHPTCVPNPPSSTQAILDGSD